MLNYMYISLLLIWFVDPYSSRPTSERGEENKISWTNFLVRFDTLFDKPTPVPRRRFPNPQFYPEFCGTSPITDKYPTPKIVGGEDAKPGEFPWQAGIALLSSREGGTSRLMCGGTILTDRTILTAAHCLKYPSIRYQVLVGILKSALRDIEPHQQTLIMEKYVKHPDFDIKTYKNDIALVLVKSSYNQGIWWNDWVLPACLPMYSYDSFHEEKTKGTVSGWGLVEEDGKEQSPVLQHVDIEVQDLRVCQNSYSAALVSDNQFCAGHKSGGKDSCSGDSGGPFVVQDASNGRYFVTGVVSFGVGCGRSQYPGVYTRVDKYLSWIQKELEINDVSMYQDITEKQRQLNLMRIMERQISPSTSSLQYLSNHMNSLQPICAGNSKVLSCPASSFVQITDVFFGRDSMTDCHVSSLLPKVSASSCSLTTALSDLTTYCQGKRLCTVVAATKEEGGPFSSNPCPDQDPYVKVTYDCQYQGHGEEGLDSGAGANYIQRRTLDSEINFKNNDLGITSKHQEFPEKKSAAWHSRPMALNEKSFEASEPHRLHDHRLRFLFHETKSE